MWWAMRILMVASEAIPFAKTGGLADVLGALPRALARMGHHVDVLMPRYRGVTQGEAVGRVSVTLGGRARTADLYGVTHENVLMLFVDQPEFYDRDALYGTKSGDYDDNAARFAFLCNAAVDWMVSTRARYDIVHAHDWQAGLVPALLADFNRASALAHHPATVFTIHNLAYQGIFDPEWLPRLGLPWDLMRAEAMEFWGRVSFLKAGIVFSEVVTTVSPRYAAEIQTPEFGFGFDGLLRQRASDLVGILNGIDYDEWDPARDPALPEPFSASALAGKAAAKRKVLDAFALPATDEVRRRPLVAMVSRLVDQKGFDLIAGIADELPRLDATFVLLGTGDPAHEALWRDLAVRYPDRVGARIGFDESLAHLIEGGADLFLMPSRFEPCGLNQMYSLRYGTVPVVRAVGGLYDTVRNYDPATGEGTGFTFMEHTPEALLGTLRWALETFRDAKAWSGIQQAGMRQDHSWGASARQYLAVYDRALRSRAPRTARA
jgi:starch synthase